MYWTRSLVGRFGTGLFGYLLPPVSKWFYVAHFISFFPFRNVCFILDIMRPRIVAAFIMTCSMFVPSLFCHRHFLVPFFFGACLLHHVQPYRHSSAKAYAFWQAQLLPAAAGRFKAICPSRLAGTGFPFPVSAAGILPHLGTNYIVALMHVQSLSCVI